MKVTIDCNDNNELEIIIKCKKIINIFSINIKPFPLIFYIIIITKFRWLINIIGIFH